MHKLEHRIWKKCPKSEGMPTIMLEVALANSRTTLEFIRWKVHNDWIVDVRFYVYVSILDTVMN